jgi:membrane-associated protease RseP (regulator of RpoE activity)
MVFTHLLIGFLIVLLVSSIFHEMGHLLAAKRFGISVQSLSIGIGPELFDFRIKGILYKLHFLPLGGKVGFVQKGVSDKHLAYAAAAGPIANIVLAALSFFLLFFTSPYLQIFLKLSLILNALRAFTMSLPARGTDGNFIQAYSIKMSFLLLLTGFWVTVFAVLVFLKII